MRKHDQVTVPLQVLLKLLIMKNLLFNILFIVSSFYCTSAQQAHINPEWDPQRNAENLGTFSAYVISPEVSDDHTVIFRLKAPDVSNVLVAGRDST